MAPGSKENNICSDISSTNINNTDKEQLYSYDPLVDNDDDNRNRVTSLPGHRRSRSRRRIDLDQSLELDIQLQINQTRNMATPDQDVWAMLQQKEADLLLAAELGKALLDKNTELTKQQETLNEQYSAKLEALEQEKHLLRRKLQAVEEESEARLLELQSDIRELTEKLEQRGNNVKQSDKEKTTLITELTAQNNRLTNQLKEASGIEAQLTAQLDALKDQCSIRKTSLQDHVSSLEALKEELQLTTDKKADLERRLQTALLDRDQLAQQYEEACDRIAMLERHVREQELKYHNSFTDMERLQRENSTLSERLGGAPGNGGPLGPRRTLHAEMESDAADSKGAGPPASEIIHVYKQLRALCSHLRSNHDDDSGLHSDLSINSLDGEPTMTLKPGVLAEVAEDLALLVSGMEGIRFKDMLEKLGHQLHDRDADLQSKNDLIMELQTKISIWEVELAGAKEEAANAKSDAAGGSLARDQAVSEARTARDAAHARRIKAESDAAKARVELAQAAGQLLEAVRQKVELSQQLDQWQMDMQELIEEQMRNKLSSQERKRKVVESNRNEPTRTSKILGFFQR